MKNRAVSLSPGFSRLRETNGFLATVDLRLDNRESLVETLGRERENLLAGDEVLFLSLLESQGTGILSHIRGAYAGMIVDRRNGEVTLFRDPMGERPLFYCIFKNSVAFASSLSLLFEQPGIPRTPNLSTLADYAFYNFTVRESTPFKGVFRVPPGGLVTINADGCKTIRSFHVWDACRTVHLPSRRDYAEALREKLETAVARRIRGAGKVGSHLSSGLDSGSVASIAARLLKSQGKELQSFTWTPGEGRFIDLTSGRYGDERYLAEDIARMSGNIRMHLVSSAPQLHSTAIDDESFFMAAPDFLRMSDWYESIMKRAGIMGLDVMLTGFKGNFSFSFNGTEPLGALVGQRDVRRILSQLVSSLEFRQEPWIRDVLRRIWRRAGNPRRTGAASSLPRPGWLDFTVANFKKSLTREASDRARDARVNDFFEGRVTGHPYLRAQAAVGESWWADYWFHLENRYKVVMRDPTADQDLLEFCLGVPEACFAHRNLARRAVRDLLPDKVIRNPERGLQNGDWRTLFTRSMPSMLEEVALLEKSELAGEILDVKRLKALLEKWPPTNQMAGHIMATYMFAVFKGLQMGKYLRWMERFCG